MLRPHSFEPWSVSATESLHPLLHFGHAGTEKKGQALHGASNPTASPYARRLAPKVVTTHRMAASRK